MKLIVIDGARFMTGTVLGFVGISRQNQITVHTLHCIIYKEALCQSQTVHHHGYCHEFDQKGKLVPRSQKCLFLLEEMDSAHGDLLLHTEVTWLSRGVSTITIILWSPSWNSHIYKGTRFALCWTAERSSNVEFLRNFVSSPISLNTWMS